MLRIARAVSLRFRAAGARPCASLARRRTLAIRVAWVLGAEGIGTGRDTAATAAWRIGHCAAGSALSSVLIAGASLLPVTTRQRESRTDNQDRFFHIDSFVFVFPVDLTTVEPKLDARFGSTNPVKPCFFQGQDPVTVPEAG